MFRFNEPSPGITLQNFKKQIHLHRSRWPRGIRPRLQALACRDYGFESRPVAWIFACCECVLSGRDLCDELIARPEEPYRLCYVVVFDL